MMTKVKGTKPTWMTGWVRRGPKSTANTELQNRLKEEITKLKEQATCPPR